jgi:hypothetical protein
MSLREEIRQEVKERQQHRENWRKHDAAADELRSELKSERNLRERILKNRKNLHRQLRKEAERDLEAEGIHTDEWEDRIDSRLDVIADEIEVCEFEIHAIFAKATRHRDLRSELAEEIKDNEERIERLRERLRRRQQETSDQLSKDFHLSEFDCRNGQTVKANVPEIIPHLEALCQQHLQPLRDSGGTVAINSGFRPQAYNASIGGAPLSYHRYELRKTSPAADHIQSGRAASAVQAWHESHNPFDGMGFYAGFTHGDDRGYHVRWYGAA